MHKHARVLVNALVHKDVRRGDWMTSDFHATIPACATVFDCAYLNAPRAVEVHGFGVQISASTNVRM